MNRGIYWTTIALPLAFALPLLAVGLLPAPADFAAALTGEVIETSWTAVTDATKYSVCIVAEYDTDGIEGADMSVDFDFGTSDRTDGYLMSDPFLDIPVAALELLIDVNGDGTDESFMPVSVQARVKALNPGKGMKRQDNPFCEFVTVDGFPLP